VVRRRTRQDHKADLTGRLARHRPSLLNSPAVVDSPNAVAARAEIASTDGTQIPAFTLWKTLRYD
jgi:prolyl oligopeptidase PreP (S9A serine peptidase family)